MAKVFLLLIIFFFTPIFTSHSLINAVEVPSSSSSSTIFTISPAQSPSSLPLLSTSENLESPEFLCPLSSIAKILIELGFHDFARAIHSLSLSSDLQLPWYGPLTIFAPSDSSVRTCSKCSLTVLLQEHTVSGLYSFDYVSRFIFGTKMEAILPGRCLTVTAAINRGNKIFIGGAEITQPDLYVSDLLIIHGVQGFLSHLSPFSCAIDKMTSLSLPHVSPSTAFTRIMLTDAMIRLRLSGYSVLALAIKVKYIELATLKNMTIFAVDDSSIFHGGHAYVHTIRYHIIPNMVLKFTDLENLPQSKILPTLEAGETITVTTPGGGEFLSPLRINYVKIRYPNLIINSKLVIHGISTPFPHLRQSISVGGNSEVHPAITSEFGTDARDLTIKTTSSPSGMKTPVEAKDYAHQGL
ncbi:unnamed protein product [Amaranthus hypochondriacus]